MGTDPEVSREAPSRIPRPHATPTKVDNAAIIFPMQPTEKTTRGEAEAKYADLVQYLQSFDTAAVAFSGGVDSTLLLHAAHEAIGDRALAITVQSPLFPQRETDEAHAFCTSRRIPHLLLRIDALDDVEFVRNPQNRCYLCKRRLMTNMLEAARREGFGPLVEGSNVDDDADYRPGAQAIRELGIESPLKRVGLTKDEIRVLSAAQDLPTWNKQSFACLATRFEFDEPITREGLEAVGKAEQYLIDMGFRQVRVRSHGRLARIEVDPEQVRLLTEDETRERLCERFGAWGFDHVTVDLAGYRMGSMNASRGET